jgi:ribonuclease/clavin/mitogillin
MPVENKVDRDRDKNNKVAVLILGGRTVVKINDHIGLVISETGFTYCNCLFIDDDIRTIIDTGANRKSLEEIEPGSVDMVLYTHHHIDHIRGNRYFPRATKYIHELDFPALQNMENFIHYNSIDRWRDLMPGDDFIQTGMVVGLHEGLLEGIWDIDNIFSDDTIFDLGHTRVQAIHTPGHSRGHCVYWFPEEELLFSGDICLTKAGPWYGEVYSSPDDMLDSIERVIRLKPKYVTSCHVREVYEDVMPRLIEYKNRIYKREERIYNYLKTRTAEVHEIANQHLIYRYHPSSYVVFWEKLMIIKHL